MKRTGNQNGGDQDGRSAHRLTPEKLSGQNSGSGRETPGWEQATSDLLTELPELFPLFRALANCDPNEIDMSKNFGDHNANNTGKSP